MIFKRLTVDKNIIKISLYKAMQEIKQSIIDKMLPKSQSIAESKWHYQVFEDAKSGKRSGELF